jgi:hypothetical protein
MMTIARRGPSGSVIPLFFLSARENQPNMGGKRLAVQLRRHNQAS